MDFLRYALSQVGIKEIVGREHNPEVLKYFHETGHTWVKDDETSWCSAFVNWCAKMSNLPYSGKLTARSWLRKGKEVFNPVTGDIVVLWRESVDSWKGHVGIFIREQGNYIYILGGNQKNSVCIQAYQKRQLLQYRRLQQ